MPLPSLVACKTRRGILANTQEFDDAIEDMDDPRPDACGVGGLLPGAGRTGVAGPPGVDAALQLPFHAPTISLDAYRG